MYWKVQSASLIHQCVFKKCFVPTRHTLHGEQEMARCVLGKTATGFQKLVHCPAPFSWPNLGMVESSKDYTRRLFPLGSFLTTPLECQPSAGHISCTTLSKMRFVAAANESRSSSDQIIPGPDVLVQSAAMIDFFVLFVCFFHLSILLVWSQNHKETGRKINFTWQLQN